MRDLDIRIAWGELSIAVIVFLAALLWGAPAAAQATPSSRILWDQPAADVVTAQGYTYRYYPDSATVGIVFTGVVCVPATTGMQSCSVLFPAFTPGAHTLTLTAGNATSESAQSAVLAFTFAVIPGIPLNPRVGGGLMAIAFDATSGSGEVTTSSYSWSHTCAGTERLLLVGVNVRDATSDTVTGITYNSVALTKLRADDAGAGFRARSEIWYLVNPATGANTVAVTLSGTPEDSSAGAVSFTGVDQTTPMDVAGGEGAAFQDVQEMTDAITPVTDGAWVFAVGTAQLNRAVTIGANQTQRWSVTYGSAQGEGLGSTSSAAISPAASKTMNWTWTTNCNAAISLAAVRPAGAGGSVIPVLMAQYRKRRN